MPGGYGLPLMMGLGLAGDVMGGISAYEQARRQRDQYNYAKQFQNPYWVLQQSQPYIDQLNATLKGQTQNIMRSEVNPMIGSRGIDPTSGAGQSIYAQALAPYIMRNQEVGRDQFLRATNQGQHYGVQNIGPTYGSNDGLKRALYAYYMRGADQPQQQSNSVNANTPYAGDSGLEGLERWSKPAGYENQFYGLPGGYTP